MTTNPVTSTPAPAATPARDGAPADPHAAADAPAAHSHAGHSHGPVAGGLDLDRVGATASFICAIHCAAIPVLLILGGAGFLPVLGHDAVGIVEWAFVGVAGVIGPVSAWRGYRVHRKLPVALVLAGAALALVALMLVSRHGHDDGHGHEGTHQGALRWIFPALGVTLAVAHIWNRRLLRSCGCGAAQQASS